MNQTNDKKPKIAIVTLIQEGVVKVGGEHAMLFPYVEQAIKAAETVKDKIDVIPYVISPRPKKLENLARVEELKKKMNEMNDGEIILVSNGADGPYADPWNWEKYGYEANKTMINLVKKKNLAGLIIMAHGYSSIPAVLNLSTAKENNLFGKIPISCFYITHSSFDEHKDSRPQRRILEREIHNHAKMIAISPYMSQHLEDIALVESKKDTIPLYNALPEEGWFSNRIPKNETLELLRTRNETINSQGPFYGAKLPIDDILAGKKEMILYFGRAQKYVKGTDAVIACAAHDTNRHYFVICSGSEEELDWHKKLIKDLDNVTLAWEHNSKLVLGTVQLTENDDKVRIIALFLSRREPMGLVSRELVLMQDNGSVLPIVSDNCGFDDKWQREYSFVVTNPCVCEDDEIERNKNSTLKKTSDIFIHDSCIENTLEVLDKIGKMSIEEIRKRVQEYSEAVKKHYSQDRYWSFYLEAVSKVTPNYKNFIEQKVKENNLMRIPNI